MTTKWRGALLYCGLLAASTAAFTLRTTVFNSESGGSTVTAPHPASSVSGESDSTPSGSRSPSSKRSAPGSAIVTGDIVKTRYGPVQVKVTFDGSTITDVRTLKFPDDEDKSVRINKSAIPELRAEILASQSASIDTVSGATYTSDGYAESVQSAIDQR